MTSFYRKKLRTINIHVKDNYLNSQFFIQIYKYIEYFILFNFLVSAETIMGTVNSMPRSMQVTTRPDLVAPLFNVINTDMDVTSSSIRVSFKIFLQN